LLTIHRNKFRALFRSTFRYALRYVQFSQAASLRLAALCFVGLSLLLASCTGKRATSNAEPIATFGKQTLTAEELKHSLRFSSRQDSSVKAALYIEDWKQNAALVELARKNGEPDDELTALLIEKSSRKIIAQRFLDRKLAEASARNQFVVSLEEAKSHYAQNFSTYVFSRTMVKLTVLYAANPDSAVKLQKVLSSPTSADSLVMRAMQLSPPTAEQNQASIENGLVFKPISEHHLESELLRSLLERLQPKSVSAVVKLENGMFVVMRLEERVQQGQQKKFDDAYPDVVSRLQLEKQKRFTDSLIATAK
jgi:adenylate kinase family enzyme